MAKSLFSRPTPWICGLVVAFGAMALAPAQAEDWPKVSEATLQKYLFADDPSGQDRLERWESDMVLDFYFTNGKSYMKELVQEFNQRGLMGGRQVHLLPPANMQRGSQVDRFDFALGVREDFYNLALQSEEEGGAAYVSHAQSSGCFAKSVVRGSGGGSVITAGKIMARKDLSKDEIRDCLLRGMLISAGLEHTQELAFDNQPMSETEREEAFDVLQLLYHPSVRSGMTRAEFTQALRSQGLVE